MYKKMSKALLTLGWVVVWLCLPAQGNAAVVTLHNGDRLTGEVRQMTDGMLVLSSSVFGEVKIPWRQVASLVTDQEVRLALQDDKEIKGTISLDDDAIVVSRASVAEGPVRLARDSVVAVNPPIVDPAVKYTGRLDVGGTANRGNSQDDQVNVNGELVARTARNRYTLSGEAKEAKSGGIKTASSRRLMAQYDVFLKNKNYVLFNAKTERDRFADLNSRSALGVGYGYQFIDTEPMKLSGEAGLSYVFENYANQPRQSFPAVSMGLKFDRLFMDGRLIYFHHLTTDTSLDGPSSTWLRNRMGIRIPIAKGVNVSAQFNVDYNNTPATDKKKADSAVIVSLGYAF